MRIELDNSYLVKEKDNVIENANNIEYVVDNANVRVENGYVIAQKVGESTVTIKYTGSDGVEVSSQIKVIVSLIEIKGENLPVLNLTKNKLKTIVTYKKSRLLLQILYANSEMFLNLLKKINKETEIAESVLKTSMKNKELLQLLGLEKSLVYFTTSLKSNEVVMEKTMRGKIIKLYDEDEDILEDAIIENKQAIEMAKIYSDILTGTMDAYASIISNNLNGVMKFLTSITIILAIPTMIGSFWGMNVSLPFENNHYGFVIMIFIAIIVTLLVTVWLNKKDMLN